MPVPSVATPEGRRFWAFFVMLGASFVFTAFAAVGVWLVSGNTYYSLILALAAHVQLFVCIGAFGWVLGRRMNVKGGRDGFEYSDADPETLREAVQAPATAAQQTADQVIEAIEGTK